MNRIKTPLVKRIFDIMISSIFIILTLPLSLLIILLLVLEQLLRGNLPMPLYIEKRVSQGQAFNFIKFNIFKPRVIREFRRNNQYIDTKKVEHDGKSTTWIGHWVQRVYLDELPQLFLILIGKMSFVGPRPRDIRQYEKGLEQGNYTRDLIKAGLTGQYQAKKGEAGANQIRLDIEYIEFVKEHNSWQILIKDIEIIIKTWRILLRAQGY